MDLNEMRRRFKEQKAQNKENKQFDDKCEDANIGSTPSNSKNGSESEPYSSDDSIQTIHFDDGAIYVGTIDENGECSGHGVCTFPDGAIYDGLWENGMPNGDGTLIWKDGAKYVGNWKDELRHGIGSMTWPDGSRYEGSWKDDNISNGHYYYSGGDYYEGDFDSDWKRDGYGTYYWTNGSCHIGHWKKGLRHGKGKCYNENRELVCEGEWIDDKFVDNTVSNHVDSSVSERVKAIIVNYLSCSPYAVVDNATFADLGADSLDTVDIVMAFEKEFDIRISEDQSDNIRTVGEAIRYIEFLLQQK